MCKLAAGECTLELGRADDFALSRARHEPSRLAFPDVVSTGSPACCHGRTAVISTATREWPNQRSNHHKRRHTRPFP